MRVGALLAVLAPATAEAQEDGAFVGLGVVGGAVLGPAAPFVPGASLRGGYRVSGLRLRGDVRALSLFDGPAPSIASAVVGARVVHGKGTVRPWVGVGGGVVAVQISTPGDRYPAQGFGGVFSPEAGVEVVPSEELGRWLFELRLDLPTFSPTAEPNTCVTAPCPGPTTSTSQSFYPLMLTATFEL